MLALPGAVLATEPSLNKGLLDSQVPINSRLLLEDALELEQEVHVVLLPTRLAALAECRWET